MLKKFRLVFLVILCPIYLQAGLPHKNFSVLATGAWYKIAVANTGIHQITFQNILEMGIDPTMIDPGNIRIFGNGGGMLPEQNSAFRIDDLREISVQVFNGGNTYFDPEDYILFYGESADKWLYENFKRIFKHQKNIYSDSNYYFLSFNEGPVNRVQSIPSLVVAPNTYSYRFNDFLFHELDQKNIVKSGRDWYGETFNSEKSTWIFPFFFPNLDTTSKVIIRTTVAAHAALPSYFRIHQNGIIIDSLRVEPLDPSDIFRGGRVKFQQSLTSNKTQDQTVTVSYSMPLNNSVGWLDYLELNCLRNLIWTGPQMSFRDVNSVGSGRKTEFVLKNAGSTLEVWDITDKTKIGAVQTTLAGTDLKFRLSTDSLHEFIAFDHAFYYPVRFAGNVPNQNLHANESSKFVIVTDPLFITEANRLADFHRSNDGITVQVVVTTQIYNEFSSGQQDPTAIRDYMKMLYEKATPENRPKYLLLFGDGSYDPKDRVPGNNNRVPTFQSAESLDLTITFVTDDYFGILGDGNGINANGKIDIGVGRCPVSELSQAKTIVDKIIHYATISKTFNSDWANVISFVADDENQNLHLHQTEESVAIVANKYPLLNINKIYLDAYPLIQIPGGSRFPDANKALNESIEKGTILINYIGHGGETGWSFEQVLTTTDIQRWNNYDRLAVFVTATCEFSRFDNPERFTAGEMVILNPEGGGIALFTTTRLTFAGQNILLDTSFFHHLMDYDDSGDYIRMGDLIRITKNNNQNNLFHRNFVLLGDPALQIAFSKYNVKTTIINNQPVNQPVTLLGLTTVTVKGIIEDNGGQKVTSFNGVLSIKVFDKPVIITTLGNKPPPETYPEKFEMQNSLLFKGSSSIKSGNFEFSFTVPKDISLQFGKGKISYYASDSLTNATGFSTQIIIGGRDSSINTENDGPDISLYLNDRSFISGGESGTAPILIAELFDTNGINNVGLGIGHEIIGILDDDRTHPIMLNDYFLLQYNSATQGTLTYPFSELSAGQHKIHLKAWDMYNNSSEKEIIFSVTNSSHLTFKKVMNAPNPLIDHTNFIFQPGQEITDVIDVKITIFSLYGYQVRSLNSNIEPGNINSYQIFWDGTDENGRKLNNGIYPYKISFRGKTGTFSETSQKLIILK